MNAPPRKDIGRTMRFARPDAASSLLETEPAISPIAMNTSIPHSASGSAMYQEPVSFRPNTAMATAMKSTNCSTAMTIETTTREATRSQVFVGVSRIRRSSLVLRQLTRVMAPPNVPPIASANPSRPGVRYWIGLSEASSTG